MKGVKSSLIIGIDGGASNTVALLADSGTGKILGRGAGGPSNIQAVGETAALRELNQAVSSAFTAAGVARGPVAAAALGLAGIDLDGTEVIQGWASLVHIAERVSVANDATLLFAAGTPEGWGLAVIAGTGSIAFALDRHGKDSRAGGWGYLLGDEGSAFRLGLLGLRAACRAADGIGEPTKLLPALLAKLGSTDPRDFIPAVYRGSWDKVAIAALAPLVLEQAEEDATARAIFEAETRELARTAAGAVAAAGLAHDSVPVALTGGLVLRSERFRECFLNDLRACGVNAAPVGLVDDPAQGAVVLAQKMLSTPAA